MPRPPLTVDFDQLDAERYARAA